jgi:hypothetical protein
MHVHMMHVSVQKARPFEAPVLDGPQLCQEKALVAPSMAMQNDGDGHDTDFGPAPAITIAGADHELPL